MTTEKKAIGRKKNPDKKLMTGIYHRPSEIKAFGSIEAYKNFIYDAVNKEIEKRTIPSEDAISPNMP